jgi:hypothetical protein
MGWADHVGSPTVEGSGTCAILCSTRASLWFPYSLDSMGGTDVKLPLEQAPGISLCQVQGDISTLCVLNLGNMLVTALNSGSRLDLDLDYP